MMFGQGDVLSQAENTVFGLNKSVKARMGFKSLLLKKYAPEAVAKITGLKPGDITSLARNFAKAKAPIALCGKGKGDLNGSLYEFMAVQSLNALVGNFNKSGGVFIQKPLPLSDWPEADMDHVAMEGLKKPRIDMAGTRRYPFTSSLINKHYFY